MKSRDTKGEVLDNMGRERGLGYSVEAENLG